VHRGTRCLISLHPTSVHRGAHRHLTPRWLVWTVTLLGCFICLVFANWFLQSQRKALPGNNDLLTQGQPEKPNSRLKISSLLAPGGRCFVTSSSSR
ncbi:mCG145463, partial [Mus musculus]